MPIELTSLLKFMFFLTTRNDTFDLCMLHYDVAYIMMTITL